MSILKCKMCGGDLNVTDNEKVVECEYCGSTQTVPDSNDEKRINLYNRANRLRMASEFDKAAGIYENIIAEFPEEAEAYWGLCLCNYGIEYVDDPATAKKIPTCHRASFEKMRKDENYELALEYADISARIVYEDQAREIDRIMGEILSISREEKPYDIFICYKETDNVGSRTPDSVLAQDIYDGLTKNGYRVFFSRITLEDKLGTQYEPYIFSALNSAKMMLVVGTDYEYFNAVWVKNEWSRFLKLTAKDKSKILIPCYKDMDPYDMPDEFKGLQSQDCGKLGFMQDLLRGIDKIFGKNGASTTQSTVIQSVSVNPTVESLLKRAFMFLEDGNFEEADEYCEKVLDIDPECAEAYLGKLMAELKVKTRENLKECKIPFDENDNYSKVIRFGYDKLKAEIKGYNEHISREKEKSEKREAERINQIVETIRISFEKKISGKNHVSLEDEKANVQKKISELTALSAIFDQRKSELDTIETENKTITSEINTLQNRRSALGLFAGKEKKEIDRKIAELTDKTKRLEQQYKKLKEELKGYASKEAVDTEIVSNQKQLEVINNQIEEKSRMSILEFSFEQALEALKDENVKAEFVKKHKNLCENDVLKVYFANVSDIIKFGNYMQYKHEKNRIPILWRVLAKEDNKILVISDKALDCQPYNSSYTNVTWENCSLRKWMNSAFLNNAFSADEQKMILSTSVSADENPEYDTNPGNDTTDKFFLLSITEAEKYFSTDEDRKCVPTEYAISQGAYTKSSYTKRGEAASWWWLRSPGFYQKHAVLVYNDGSVNHDGDSVSYGDVCVRPAMWISLE